MKNVVIIPADALGQKPNPDPRYSIEKMRRLYEQDWFQTDLLDFILGKTDARPELSEMIHTYYQSDLDSPESDKALFVIFMMAGTSN